MTKIFFLSTRRICDNGFTVKRFEKGMVHEVGSSATAVIKNHWGFEVKETDTPEMIEAKCKHFQAENDKLESYRQYLHAQHHSYKYRPLNN